MLSFLGCRMWSNWETMQTLAKRNDANMARTLQSCHLLARACMRHLHGGRAEINSGFG